MTKIENSITKIGALLALGFGEAGGIIISKNMTSEKLDALQIGRKKIALFAFCDIRNFTDATEVPFIKYP